VIHQDKPSMIRPAAATQKQTRFLLLTVSSLENLRKGYLPRNFAKVFDFGFIVDEVDAGWRLERSLRSRLMIKKFPISYGPAYAQADESMTQPSRIDPLGVFFRTQHIICLFP
jgi:hypothetical protein